jgi:hypothetical protein
MNRILYFFLACMLVNCSSSIINKMQYTTHDKNGLAIIGPKRVISHYLPKNFGHSFSIPDRTQIGIHIPLKQESRGLVKGVFIKVKKTSVYSNRKNKVLNYDKDQFAPFLINVYDFDEKSKLPTKKYLLNDSLISLNKDDKELYFDLEKYNIPFSENGIFITLENLPAEEYKKLGFKYGPSFGVIGVSKNNVIMPYLLNKRYKNQWKVYDYLVNNKIAIDLQLMILKKATKQ